MPVEPGSAAAAATGGVLKVLIEKLNLDAFMSYERRQRRAVERAKLRVLEKTVEAAGEAQVDAARKGEMVFSSDGTPRPLAWRLQQQLAEASEQFGLEVVAESFAAQIAIGIQEQENVAAVVALAEDALQNEQDPRPDLVDDDWLGRWRSGAAKVSDAEIRKLWAKTLASEVGRQGTTSFRALSMLSMMDSKDIAKLEQLKSIVLDDQVPSSDAVLTAAGLNIKDLIDLQQMGILTGVGTPAGLQRSFIMSKAGDRKLVASDSKIAIIVVAKADHQTCVLNGYPVTNPGQELLEFAEAQLSDAVIRWVASELRRQGVDVFQAPVTGLIANGVQVGDFQPID